MTGSTPPPKRAAGFLLLSTFVNNVGNGMYLIAVGKLLYDRTGSAAAFGVVMVVEQLLMFGIHLIAGPFIDQRDPKTTYVRVEYLRGGLVVLLSLMMNSGHALPWILAMTAIIQIGKPFNRAATFLLPPAIVGEEKLNRFNGHANISLQSGALFGTLLAGPLLSFFGAKTCFVVNGVSFLLSAFFIQFVPYHHQGENQDAASGGVLDKVLRLVVASWLEIAGLLRGNLALFWHLVLGSADFVAISIFSLLLAPIAGHRFGGSSYWISYLDAAFTLGAIMSAPLAERVDKALKPVAATVIGIAGQALAFSAFAWATTGSSFLLASFCVGAFNTISWAALITSLQIRTPKAVRGRVSTLRHVFTAGVTAILIPLVARAEAASLNLAFLTTGTIFLGLALLLAVLSSKPFFGPAVLESRA